MLKDLKISTRLIALISLLMATTIVLGFLSLWQMSRMQASAHEISANWLPSVELINAMSSRTAEFRLGETNHVLNTDTQAMARVEREIAAVRTEFERSRDAYVQLISSAEERRLYDAFAADWQQYLQMHEQLIELSRKNENQKAQALLDTVSKPVYDRFTQTLVRLVALNHDGSVAESTRSQEAYQTARNVVVLGLLGALALALVAGVWLVRSITRPLQQAVAAADRVASGDFTQPVASGGNDEAGHVLQSLARMQERLADIVRTVRDNAESVATASAQIAQGNHDLSQRTEEQASALQETAATMEQLGSTVRNNSDSTRQADAVAQGAAQVAGQGGQRVGQVVQTMQGISESSRRIGDIIGVIDGIAFQTNILALNAAVEAARAGEQGRGFAVVAGEVRTLAQRSAEAAKEIKGLITRNVEQVEQGTAQVGEAGTTMDEIVASIRSVSSIVSEISAATVEQSNGIGQVGGAIQQMDQTTQQNATLVEQSAAAAESLRTQAAQLLQAVSIFKLPGTPGLAARPQAVTEIRPALAHTQPTRTRLTKPASAGRAAPAIVHHAPPAQPAPPTRPAGTAAPAIQAPVVLADQDAWDTF